MGDEVTAEVERRAAAIVADLTLEEATSLCSGQNLWSTKAVERAGVPSVVVTDGPHGVRLQRGDNFQMGLDDGIPATCFPTASALAATWDRELLRDVGAAIGDEGLALGVGVVLGPGVNIKRDPRCGRNFEYLSEDPLLAGELATALVDGIQSRGVGACVKHLAGNDQEHRRMTVDAVYDDRTLHELELTAFELPIRRARPWMVMGAYNRLNGTYACEDPWLLTSVLRERWGFDGAVVTDWGAISDRVAGLAAGCDLQMPGTTRSGDLAIAAAVRDGGVDRDVLDRTATRMVALALRAEANRRPDATADHDAHHRLARRAAGEAAVLCRNEAVGDGHPALPVRTDDRVAVVGALATRPRFQGTGSSRINPTRVDRLRDELVAVLGGDRVTYANGYDDPDVVDDRLIADAVAAARDADVVVVCVGLPDGYENEGDDRAHLRLPSAHDALVAAVAAAHDRVVAVVVGGAPVELPWADDVEAVVVGYLGGQAAGGGLADVLTGAVTPCGHLAETFPLHQGDLPTARAFPAGPFQVEHRESVYVGYRFHDTVDGPVRYPFGHGLSYTTFTYGDLRVDGEVPSASQLEAGATFPVTIEVTNTGEVAGKHVVQLYVRDPDSAVHRPDRELRAFAKVSLEPGATTSVRFELGARAFAFWDVERDDWTVEPGTFELLAGASSRDLRASTEVEVAGEPLPRRGEPAVYRDPPRHLAVDAASYERLLGRPRVTGGSFGPPFTLDTPISATTGTAAGRLLAWVVERQLRRRGGDDVANQALIQSTLNEAPLRTLRMGGVDDDQLEALLELLNGRWSALGQRALRTLVLAARR